MQIFAVCAILWENEWKWYMLSCHIIAGRNSFTNIMETPFKNNKTVCISNILFCAYWNRYVYVRL